MKIEIYSGREILGKTLGWLSEKTGMTEDRLRALEALHHPFRRGRDLSPFGDEASAVVLRALEAEYKRQCDEVGNKVARLVEAGHSIELTPLKNGPRSWSVTVVRHNGKSTATYVAKGRTALEALIEAERAWDPSQAPGGYLAA